MKYLTTAAFSRIEGTLNRFARAEAFNRKYGHEAEAETVRHTRAGIIAAAADLGASCACELPPRSKTGAKKCVCARTHRMMMVRLHEMRQPGLRRRSR